MTTTTARLPRIIEERLITAPAFKHRARTLLDARRVHGVVGGDDGFTRRVLEGADSLRVISEWGTGTDSIDREAAAELGVAVYNTANAFSHPVADSVLGYILAFSRNIVQMDRLMKAGRWEKTMGTALNETIIGVIGVVNVGTQVLRRAGSFGAALLGTDIRDVDSRTTANLGVQMVSLEHLLAESDFVSVNCDLNPSSHH